MKKLNRKGFTLIELLAIIVILAIIMVVTIPTVLSSMGTAREEMFETSVNSVADWVEKQYTQAMIQTYDDAFTNVCSASNSYCASSSPVTVFDAGFLKAAGVDPKNYSAMSIQVTNGRACVKLTASEGGDFGAYKGTIKSSVGCTATS